MSRSFLKYLFIISGMLTLTACAYDPQAYQRYLARRDLPAPAEDSFPHCYGYGCVKHGHVAPDKAEWMRIDLLFIPPYKDAAEERARIAKAVALFEQIAGARTGTEADRGGTFYKFGPGQLDCVDESTNTTIYLDVLRRRGHLKFHDIEQPQMRLPVVGGSRWVHQTAVIREKETGARYAVDSWFEDNGVRPHIVPLKAWRRGWRPEG